jgi:hypothetical protein
VNSTEGLYKDFKDSEPSTKFQVEVTFEVTIDV